MALFKVLRGPAERLPSDMVDGYAYFCTDNKVFYIDHLDAQGTLVRSKLTAGQAEKLIYTNDGNIVEIDPSTIITSANVGTLVGNAESSKSGLVKLSDAVDSSSDASAGVAATPKAVKSAYDLANTANTAASGAQTTANEANTAAGNAATAASNAQTTANAAMPKAGGTFTGKAYAQANTAYTTYQLRNIALSTSAATPTGNGSILGVYS